MKSSFQKNPNRLIIARTVKIVCWLLILVLASALAFLVYSNVNNFDKDTAKKRGAKGTVYDSSVLFVLHDDNYTQTVPTFLLARFNSKKATIHLSVIPANLSATVGSKTSSLQEHFKYAGAVQVKNALQNLLGFEIDRYLGLPFTKLEDTVNKLGGIQTTIDSPMLYKNENNVVLTNLVSGEQTLNGHQVIMFLRYNEWFDQTEAANSKLGLLAKGFKQYTNESFAQKIVSIYDSLSDSIDTNSSIIYATELQNAYYVFIDSKDSVSTYDLTVNDNALSDESLKALKKAFSK